MLQILFCCVCYFLKYFALMLCWNIPHNFWNNFFLCKIKLLFFKHLWVLKISLCYFWAWLVAGSGRRSQSTADSVFYYYSSLAFEPVGLSTLSDLKQCLKGRHFLMMFSQDLSEINFKANFFNEIGWQW